MLTLEICAAPGVEARHLALLFAQAKSACPGLQVRLQALGPAESAWLRVHDGLASGLRQLEFALPGRGKPARLGDTAAFASALSAGSDPTHLPELRVVFGAREGTRHTPTPEAATRATVVVSWPGDTPTSLVGMQDVMHRRPTSGFVLSCFAPGGHLLRQLTVTVPTLMFYAWTREAVLRRAAALAGRWAAQALAGDGYFSLSGPSANPDPGQAPNLDAASPDNPRPGLGTLVAYAVGSVQRVAGKLAQQLSGKQQVWSLVLSPGDWRGHLRASVLGDAHAQPAGACAISSGKQLIPNPPGRFWADPFLVHHAGRDVLFAEEFDHQLGQAHLVALALDAQGHIEPLGDCLREPYHLSFPYVFDWQGQLYMCPEAHASGQIRVYRCDDFPLKWSLAAVLMEGVSAADTLLLPHEGRWWMLSNIDSSGGGDHCSELHVFWAEHPLSTHWTPHPANPVISDAMRARNGGLITSNEGLFRVNQVQAFGIYGAGLVVNRITQLTTEHYAEEPVARHVPQIRHGGAGQQGEIGAHHLSTNGRWSVSDRLHYARPRTPMPSKLKTEGSP